MPEHRHEELLKNPKVRAWYLKGARSTKKMYLRSLGRFVEATKTSPSELLRMSATKLVDTWNEYLEGNDAEGRPLRDAKGIRPSADNVRKAVISVLNSSVKSELAYAFMRATVEPGGNIARREHTPLPTQAQLRQALRIASPRVRAQIALIAFAGQRFGVMGQAEYDDGLRFSDMPEASFDEDGQLQFASIPTVIRVRAAISKTGKTTGKDYRAFLGQEGCELLQDYVRLRTAPRQVKVFSHGKVVGVKDSPGERVTKASPVIAPETAQRRGPLTGGSTRTFVHPNGIGDSIREVLRAVGIKGTPYSLRSYFSQNIKKAVAEGLDVDWKEYWMGHDPKVKGLYELRDVDQLIPQMRENYALGMKYVETTHREVQKNVPARVDVLKAILAATGRFTDANLEAMNEEKVIKAGNEVMQRLEVPAAKPEPAAVARSGRERRIVSAEEAESDALAMEGWDPVRKLADGRVVMERGS